MKKFITVVLAVLIFLGLSGPAFAAKGGKGEGHTPVTLCHATGSAKNPYVTITVDDDSVKYKGHLAHSDDIIPAPAGGCPVPVQPPKDYCYALDGVQPKGFPCSMPDKVISNVRLTENDCANNEVVVYERLTVRRALFDAVKQEWYYGAVEIEDTVVDSLPLPAGACPTDEPTPTPSTEPTPTETPTPSDVPTPVVTPTDEPTATVSTPVRSVTHKHKAHKTHQAKTVVHKPVGHKTVKVKTVNGHTAMLPNTGGSDIVLLVVGLLLVFAGGFVLRSSLAHRRKN